MNTSLHVAICDSSPGDRKQTERLIGRESDRRLHTTGVLFSSTFGSIDSIDASPMAYDVYFLDSTEPGGDSVDIARMLRNKGIQSAVVFCVGSIDYRACASDISNAYFLDKPITAEALSDLITILVDKKSAASGHRIELRNKDNTVYVTEEEIEYIYAPENRLEVHLYDKRVIPVDIPMDTMCIDLQNYPSLVRAGRNLIINARHIDKITLNRVHLTSGTERKADLNNIPDICLTRHDLNKEH
jgi:DNA-binding LytR/AlgR family response regulator